jgi:hypothetical protein
MCDMNNKFKLNLAILLITIPFFAISQTNSEFTFLGPKESKDIISFVTSEIKSEDTLKPTVCFYIFKLNGSGEISEIENLCKGYSYLSPQLDSSLISKIYSSKIYWKGSSDKSDYRWVVLPIFLGNPPKTTVSSGGSLFFSIREQIATIVQKFNYQMDKVIWIHPRFTMLGFEEKL